jgi:ubiquinone/menaquinone biosynthesis C-methylase UbiE
MHERAVGLEQWAETTASLYAVLVGGARREASVGVDVSQEATALATRQFARLNGAGQVEFHCASVEALPFDDESFDLVTCRLVLPYTRNGVALSEMARVLRPGRTATPSRYETDSESGKASVCS